MVGAPISKYAGDVEKPNANATQSERGQDYRLNFAVGF